MKCELKYIKHDIKDSILFALSKPHLLLFAIVLSTVFGLVVVILPILCFGIGWKMYIFLLSIMIVMTYYIFLKDAIKYCKSVKAK